MNDIRKVVPCAVAPPTGVSLQKIFGPEGVPIAICD
jgi:hypothetical protein